MSSILSIMESSGLDRKEWPCYWNATAACWLMHGHLLTDDEAEALCAHRLRKAIRVVVEAGANIETGQYPDGWRADADGTWRGSGPTELAALAALLRAVKGAA